MHYTTFLLFFFFIFSSSSSSSTSSYLLLLYLIIIYIIINLLLLLLSSTSSLFFLLLFFFFGARANLEVRPRERAPFPSRLVAPFLRGNQMASLVEQTGADVLGEETTSSTGKGGAACK